MKKYFKPEALDDRKYRTVTVDPVRVSDPYLSAILELSCRAVSDSRRTRWSRRCSVQVTLEKGEINATETTSIRAGDS